MTFCVGIKVRDGVVALADTQIVRGSEQVSKQKLAAVIHAEDSLFAMTSGLRSVRDKTLIYLDERLRSSHSYDRLYKIVNLFDYMYKQWEKGRRPGKVSGDLVVRLLLAGLILSSLFSW